MKKILIIIILSVFTLVIGFHNTEAETLNISLTNLCGEVGGNPAFTCVYAAYVPYSHINFDIRSITIQDSGSVGGSPGQFSGFDLDAIKLSHTFITQAESIYNISGLNVFDFSPAGTIFTPGKQIAPAAPKLFGTDSSGTKINNAVATLGSFDADSDSGPLADGFVSLGVDGKVSFNLTSPVSPNILSIYVGLVAICPEGIPIIVSFSDEPVVPDSVPEPSTAMFLLGSVLGLAGLWKKSKK
jgi:hypothetical protein